MKGSIPYPNILRVFDVDDTWFGKPRGHTFYLDCDHSVYLENMMMLSQIISQWESQESVIADKLNQDKEEYGWVNYLNTISLDFFCTDAGIAISRGTIEKEYSVFILDRFIACDTQAKMLLHPQAYDAIKGRLLYGLLAANHKLKSEQSVHVSISKKNSQSLIADFVHPEMYKFLSDHPWIWLIAAYQLRPLVSSLSAVAGSIKD